MGKRNGPYNPEFPEGSSVRILPSPALQTFLREWKFHHPLEVEQLAFAGALATVKSVGFYHGGDELYELVNIPGIWHESCLEPASEDRAA